MPTELISTARQTAQVDNALPNKLLPNKLTTPPDDHEQLPTVTEKLPTVTSVEPNCSLTAILDM
jgi:hypothetical protein